MSNRRVISMQKYQPSKNESVLIDTNILIDQFYPTDFSPHQEIDDVFTKLRKEKSKILLSSVQVSEFINRYIRIHFSYYKKREGIDNLDFKKDYRSTPDYIQHMNDILNILTTEIIPICTCIDDRFAQMAEEKLYKYSFSYDYNDALIVEIARIYDATLITNDHDFLNYSFSGKIVTSNPLLLATR